MPTTEDFRQPLQGQTAVALREAIIHGELQPGARLSEPELAQHFGTSRSPIREALVQLELEGFVARANTGRIFVRPLDLKEAEQLFLVRAMLEGMAARLATEAMNRKETLRLEDNVAAMLEASKQRDIVTALALGAEFHRTIIDACGNLPLQDCLLGFRARTSRYRHILASRQAFSKERVSEHRAILAALKSQRPDRVEMAMREHINVSSRETLDALRSYLESAAGVASATRAAGRQPKRTIRRMA